MGRTSPECGFSTRRLWPLVGAVAAGFTIERGLRFGKWLEAKRGIAPLPPVKQYGGGWREIDPRMIGVQITRMQENLALAPLVEKWHMRIEPGLDGKETVTTCPYIVGASEREVPVRERPGPVDDGLTMQQLTQVD